MAVIDELKILVTAEVSKAIADLDRTEKQTNKTGASFKGFAQQIAGYTTGMGLAVSATKAITSGMFNLAKESLSVAAGIERTKMEFSVLLGDLNLGSKAFDEMNELAAETPLAISDITRSGKQLLSVGVNAKDVTEKIRMLGDVAMGDAGKLERLTSAFAQLKSKGVASMEQINRFTEAGIPIIKELAANFGVAESEIFDMVSSGKVGFSDVENSLKSLTGEGGLYHDMMKQVAETTEGKWSTAQDNFRMILADMGENILPLVNKALDEFNKKISRDAKLDGVTKAFSGTGSSIEDVTAAIEIANAGIKKFEKQTNEAAKMTTQAYRDEKTRLEFRLDFLKQIKEGEEAASKVSEKAAAEAKIESEKKLKIFNENEDEKKKRLEQEKNDKEEAYQRYWEGVIRIQKAEEKLYDGTEGIVDSVKDIGNEIDQVSSAWGDWTLQIGDTEMSLENLKESGSIAWGSISDAYGAYLDLQNNGNDAIIAALEEQRDQMEKNGQDTTAMDKKIKDKKNEFAQKQFDAQKAVSLANVAINTAEGAMKAYTIDPTGILSAIVVAAGLYQGGMVSAQQYVPFASGGYVDQPTHALVGEAGGEWILNKSQMAGLAKNGISGGGTTIIQNISGSIWSTKSLESMAVSAQAKASRGF